MTERCLNYPQAHTALKANSPMGRAAEPEELAGLTLFLYSPATSFVTGTMYLADGGMTAH